MKKQNYCCKPRRIGSKGAVLVLIWSCLVSGSYFSTIGFTIDGLPDIKSTGAPLAIAVILSELCCPFVAWIAGVYCGRYKVIRASLWLMWVGSIIVVLAQTVEIKHPEIVHYSVIVLAAVVTTLGFSVLLVNALPFGHNLMPDASAEEISALIYWFVWSMYGIGPVIAQIGDFIPHCTHLQDIEEKRLQSLIPVTLSSLALCCDFLLKGWLTIEPVGPNPFKLVFRVLKFAMTHKYPKQLSAFTHCEDERSSRIDFAKSKYGGPFTTEEVEDVKTGLRILVVVLCMSTFLVPLWTYHFSTGNLYNHFVHPSEITQCYNVLLVLTYSSPSIIVVSIPLYEVLIRHVARRLIPSIMKRIGISIFLVIVLSLITLSIDTAGHLHNHSLPCMFKTNESSVIEANYIWVDVLTYVLPAISFMFFKIAAFEFISAQAPCTLKGLLIGLVNFVGFSSVMLGYIIYLAWDLGWTKTVTQPSCGFWFHLFIALTTTVGLVIWCIVAKWYKRRERDEPSYEHMFVVDHFDKYYSPQTNA